MQFSGLVRKGRKGALARAHVKRCWLFLPTFIGRPLLQTACEGIWARRHMIHSELAVP
jgi:hypothetical protein